MNASEGHNNRLEDHGWGKAPISRNTRGLLELNDQFLRFREMVKLTRMGENHQLTLVV